ncbi:MAG TPA: tautomerase family protein [Pinirhizobacter sp.]|uniref:tautomerase family protein n=1 Tax=Pinirhizobacter sp. TaxID=2950432 RepID=UPI002CE1197F|nr:tautomerase family protein [Pinirhizobacter sp.]HMH66509.1 tautomerase family protein [Pinirhizobacter sp.]
MPIARIELARGKSPEHVKAIGQAVYDAMLAIGVPQNDRFQVITEHDPDRLVFDRTYLGIERTDDFILVQITMNEGRTLELKKKLYQGIADGIHAATGVRKQDVMINLVEVKKENWSFGNGEAQYA